MEKDLNKLRDRAYRCACEHGFHDNEYSDAHFLMLVITEISEAVEADRKNRHAKMMEYDECQHYSYPHTNEDFISDFERYIKDSVEDEISDVAIRLLDLSGLRSIDINAQINEVRMSDGYLDDKTFSEIAFRLCKMLTDNMFNGKYNHSAIEDTIICSLHFVIKWCKYLNINMFQHIEWKMKYNELRPHLNGKKY